MRSERSASLVRAVETLIGCGLVGLIGALIFGSAATHAQAQTPAVAPTIDADVVEQVKLLAASTPQAGAPRVEVVVGQLDPRLRLAPCERVEPYLPAGVRLWGKVRIGLRCAQGPFAWNVYLPVTVKVYGRALVVPNGGVAGATLAAQDLVEAEVDLAEEFTPAVVDRAAAEGRVLAATLRPGQTLRQGHLKIRQWFQAGETVKIVVAGSGFALETEGQALSNGVDGQPARVRLDSGRIVSGSPAGDRRVQVSP